MNLPRDHENEDFSRPPIMIGASQKHVEATFVGAERVK
jgi:hypothetical protein